MASIRYSGLTTETEFKVDDVSDRDRDGKRTLHRLAGRLLHHRRRDLPESGAWGVSPIEKYFDARLDIHFPRTAEAD